MSNGAEMGKVFVFCPTYSEDGVEQMRPETEQAIGALRWGGGLETLIGRYNPYDDGKLNILHQYKTARGIFLKTDCTAMLTVEHDMLPPANGVTLLAQALDSAQAQVAYGVYMLRHGARVINAWRLEGRQYVGQSLTLFPDELARAEAARVWEVSGIGFGFTLIRRAALEALDFHQTEDGAHPVPDVPFGVDCLRSGFRQVAVFSCPCGHIEPDGNILWPLKGDDWDMVAVKVLQNVNVDVGNNVRKLQAGATESLPDAVAHELARAGYVQIKASKAAVKIGEKPGKLAVKDE